MATSADVEPKTMGASSTQSGATQSGADRLRIKMSHQDQHHPPTRPPMSSRGDMRDARDTIIGANGIDSQIEAKPRISAPHTNAITRIECPTRMPWQAVIYTHRVQLRPLHADDRAQFVPLVEANADHLSQFTPMLRDGESANAMFERHLARTSESSQSGKGMRRVVVLPDNTIVGSVNFNRIDRGVENIAEISFWIASEHTNHGFALEIVRAMVAFAFMPLPSGLGLHTVRAFVQTENIASGGLLEKAGFAHTARRTPVHTDGRYVLHDEWEIEVAP